MENRQIGRYSKYIRPFSVMTDLVIINLFCLYFFRELNINIKHYVIYQSIIWLVVALWDQFYEIYRYSNPIKIVNRLATHTLYFFIMVTLFFPFYPEAQYNLLAVLYFIASSMLVIGVLKFLKFYYLKQYRIKTGSNFRTVIIVGYSQQSIALKELFDERLDYGYKFLGFFSDMFQNDQISGTISDIKNFITTHNIDEIYCSLSELTNEQVKDLIEFGEDTRRTVKFIPDTKEIFTKDLRIDYYEYFPVLSIRKTILHDPIIQLLKRIFDILFSLLVIIFFLSWLTPILAFLIKLESRGPIFFKQGRPGMDEKEFFCYKFRSMRVNKTTEKEASKNDPRVTKIGRFIRKTSLDEMPQFLNVLLGDMSVVGPRPHLWSQNVAYGSRIKKYMYRHYVKPGITGLAQVRGYRGEIETDEDMINRIKYDVFYIENWSLYLDIKIIIQTVVNIFKGEEKAY